MSFQAMAAAVDVDLPGNKKCLLMMMANYADENGFCYPSVSTLAQDAGVSERSVQNYLAEFAEKGIIEVHTRKTESGSTTSNLYRLMLHKAPQIVRARKARNNRGANTAPYPANDDKVGRNGCGEGVQPFPDGGATVAPKPIIEPITEPVIEPVDDAGASSSTQAVDCVDHEHTDATVTDYGTTTAIETEDPFLSNRFSSEPGKTLPDVPAVIATSKHSRETFEMHHAWQPSESTVRTYMARHVAALGLDRINAELDGFRLHYLGTRAKRQGQWEKDFLSWLGRVRPEPAGTSPNTPATPQQKRAAVTEAIMDINDTDW